MLLQRGRHEGGLDNNTDKIKVVATPFQIRNHVAPYSKNQRRKNTARMKERVGQKYYEKIICVHDMVSYDFVSQ